ncbi:Crp/Fnr family transcriptional regulator [Paenibacillus sp. CF384]|uniref:Crp/Fnr family transcriptional regulator n=1 Tax=Paenibacillus sp. CF384 TaxID=1884382 RepID=UPI00089B47A5|nr:Crp/Fnr family transcriptional regulator [Paenibacillus sp. CF384]SDW03791.1 CRP/FNR family transcriptional regulator, anaerobic regulatory protein [Paenibacillus sp. CF384]
MIVSEHLSLIISLFPSLAEITEEDWNQDGITVLQMEPNYIIEEGQILEYAMMILEGTVRMYKISAGGREITLYRIHGGDCCPLMTTSILGEGEYEASACVETTGLVLAIPVAIFRDWTDRYKSFRRFIFKSFANRIVIMSNLLDSIHFKSIRGRIAEFLIQMSEKAGKSDTLHITHDIISVELGSAREVISRSLKLLEKEEIIQLARGRIIITNRSALESYIEL